LPQASARAPGSFAPGSAEFLLVLHFNFGKFFAGTAQIPYSPKRPAFRLRFAW
jgi:hypothetical protein